MVSCELSKNLGIAGKWDDCQQEEKKVVVVMKKGRGRERWSGVQPMQETSW